MRSHRHVPFQVLTKLSRNQPSLQVYQRPSFIARCNFVYRPSRNICQASDFHIQQQRRHLRNTSPDKTCWPLYNRRSLSFSLCKHIHSTSNKMATISGKMNALDAKDPTTLSNYWAFPTKHTALSLTIDFEEKKLYGNATLTFEAAENSGNEILLDTRALDIQDIDIVKGATLKSWKLGQESQVGNYGKQLKIELSWEPKKNDLIVIKMKISTTDGCTALQWLTPEQTTGKKHPYMFSQCQASHARTIFPCADTPACKSTFSYSIRSPLPVVASGLPTTLDSYDPKTKTLLYCFEQENPIPAYLMAVASGNIGSVRVGPRSSVWGEAEDLVRYKDELDGEVESFIEIAEKMITPYAWSTYNVLVLPASFPYGGMENPVWTYATPTIISGDKSNIDVIAHELAHSWSGNLVTNAGWNHFYLNEGWTVYIERRIGAALHGPVEFDFSALIGWRALEESVKLFGEDHEFTKLITNLVDQDPDDAFSSIPYEKGFTFLYHLDNSLGREKWDKFIPHYFKTFAMKSLTSFDFQNTLFDFFKDDEVATKVLKHDIDWEKWFFAPGMPPKPKFDTSLVDVCYELAKKWEAVAAGEDTSFTPSPSDIKELSSNQLVFFLDQLAQLPKPFTPKQIELMADNYHFGESGNAEILSRWYGIALKAKDDKWYKPAAEWVGTVGRMKFVRPIFRGLNECDHELAVKTFEANKSFYHPICRNQVQKDLGL